jgi:hypothetical protein
MRLKHKELQQQQSLGALKKKISYKTRLRRGKLIKANFLKRRYITSSTDRCISSHFNEKFIKHKSLTL